MPLRKSNEDPYFVPKNLLDRSELSPSECLMYIYILNNGFSSKEEMCKKYNIKENKFNKLINSLLKKGYLKPTFEAIDISGENNAK